MSEKQRGANYAQHRVAATATLSCLLPSARLADNSQSGNLSQVGRGQSAHPHTALQGVQKHDSSTHSVPEKGQSSVSRHSNLQSELETAFQKRLKQPKKRFQKETPNSSSSSNVSESPAPQVHYARSDSSTASSSVQSSIQPHPQPQKNSHFSVPSPQVQNVRSGSSTLCASIPTPYQPQTPKHSHISLATPSPQVQVQNVRSESSTLSARVQSPFQPLPQKQGHISVSSPSPQVPIARSDSSKVSASVQSPFQSQPPKHSHISVSSPSSQIQNTRSGSSTISANIPTPYQPQTPKHSHISLATPSPQVQVQNVRSESSKVSASIQSPFQPLPQKQGHISVSSPSPQVPIVRSDSSKVSASITSPFQSQPPKHGHVSVSSPSSQIQNTRSGSSTISANIPTPYQPQTPKHSHISVSSPSSQIQNTRSGSSTISANIPTPYQPQTPKHSHISVSSPSPQVQIARSDSSTVSARIQSPLPTQLPKHSYISLATPSPQAQVQNVRSESSTNSARVQSPFQPLPQKHSHISVSSPSPQVQVQSAGSESSTVSARMQSPFQPLPQKHGHIAVSSPSPQVPIARSDSSTVNARMQTLLQTEPQMHIHSSELSPPPPPRSSSLQRTQNKPAINGQVQNIGIPGYRKVSIKGIRSPSSFNQDFSDVTDSEDCRTPDPSLFNMSEGYRTPLESEDEAETASKHSFAASSTKFPFKSEIVKHFEKPLPVFLKCQSWCNQIPDAEGRQEVNDPNLKKELQNIESFESAMLDWFQTLAKTNDDEDLRSETSVSSMGSCQSEYKLRSLINTRFQNSEQIENVLADLLKVKDQYAQVTDTESVASESQKPENYQTLNLEKKSFPRRGRATVIRRSSIPGDISGSESESEHQRKPGSYKTVLTELQSVLRQRKPFPEPPDSEESGLGSSENSYPPNSPLSPNSAPPPMPKPQFSTVHQPKAVKTAQVSRKPLVNTGDFKMLLGELSTAWSKRLRRIKKAQLVSQRGMQSSLYANFQGFRIPEALLEEEKSSKYSNFAGKLEPAEVLVPGATTNIVAPNCESDSEAESASQPMFCKRRGQHTERGVRPSEIVAKKRASRSQKPVEAPSAPSEEMTGQELLESMQQPGLKQIDFKLHKYIKSVASGSELPEISEEIGNQSPGQRRLATRLNKSVEPVPTSVRSDVEMPTPQSMQGQVTSPTPGQVTSVPQTSQMKSATPTQSSHVRLPSSGHMQSPPTQVSSPQVCSPPSAPNAQVWSPPSLANTSTPVLIYGPIPFQKPMIKSSLPLSQEKSPAPVPAHTSPAPSAQVSSPPPPCAQVMSPAPPPPVRSPPQQPTQVPVPPPPPDVQMKTEPSKASTPMSPTHTQPGSAFTAIPNRGRYPSGSDLIGKVDKIAAGNVHASPDPAIQKTLMAEVSEQQKPTVTEVVKKREETPVASPSASSPSIPSNENVALTNKILPRSEPVASSPVMFRCITPTTRNAIRNAKTEEERIEILERLNKIGLRNLPVKEELPELPMDIVIASAIKIQPLQIDRLIRSIREESEEKSPIAEEIAYLKKSEIVLDFTSPGEQPVSENKVEPPEDLPIPSVLSQTEVSETCKLSEKPSVLQHVANETFETPIPKTDTPATDLQTDLENSILCQNNQPENLSTSTEFDSLMETMRLNLESMDSLIPEPKTLLPETSVAAAEIIFDMDLENTVVSENHQSTADEIESENLVASTELDSVMKSVLLNMESMDSLIQDEEPRVEETLDLSEIEACIVVSPAFSPEDATFVGEVHRDINDNGEDYTKACEVSTEGHEAYDGGDVPLSVVFEDSIDTETITLAEDELENLWVNSSAMAAEESSTTRSEFTIVTDAVHVTHLDIQTESLELRPVTPLIEVEPALEAVTEIEPTSDPEVIPDWSTVPDVSSGPLFSSPSDCTISSDILTEAPLIEVEPALEVATEIEPASNPEVIPDWWTAPISALDTLLTNPDDVSDVGLQDAEVPPLEEVITCSVTSENLTDGVIVSDIATAFTQLEPFISVLSPIEPEMPIFQNPPEVFHIPVQDVEPTIINSGEFVEISEKKDILVAPSAKEDSSLEPELSLDQLKQTIKEEMLKSEDISKVLVLESLKSFGPNGSPDDYEYEDALCYSSDDSLTFEDTLTSPLMPRRVYKEVVRAEIGTRIETLQSWVKPEPLKSWPNQENLQLCTEEMVADPVEDLSQEEFHEVEEGIAITDGDVPFNPDQQQPAYTLPTIYEATEESLEEERRILREIDHVDQLIDECVETLEMSPVELAQVQEQDPILRSAEIKDFISEMKFERDGQRASKFEREVQIDSKFEKEVQIDSKFERDVQIGSVLTSLANLKNDTSVPSGELKRSQGLTALDQICDDQSPESQVQDGSPQEKVSDHVSPDTLSDDEMLHSIPYNVTIEKPELFEEEILPATSTKTIFDQMGVVKILEEERFEETEDEISPVQTRSEKTSDEEENVDTWIEDEDRIDLDLPKVIQTQQPLADKFENLIEFLESDAAKELQEFERIESVCERLSKDHRKDSVVSNFSVENIEKSEEFERMMKSLDSELEEDVDPNVLPNPQEDPIPEVVMAQISEACQKMVTSDYKSDSEDQGKLVQDLSTLSSRDPDFFDAYSGTEYSEYMLTGDPEDSGYIEAVPIKGTAADEFEKLMMLKRSKVQNMSQNISPATEEEVEDDQNSIDIDYLNYMRERENETYEQMASATPVMSLKATDIQNTDLPINRESTSPFELVITSPEEQELGTISEEISLMPDSLVETKEMPLVISDEIEEEYFTIKGTENTVEKAFEYLLSSKTVSLKEDNEIPLEPKTDPSLCPVENSASTSEDPCEEIILHPTGDLPEGEATKLSKATKKQGHKNKKGKVLKDDSASISEAESKINIEISTEQETIISSCTSVVENTIIESLSEAKMVNTEKPSEDPSISSSSSGMEESMKDSSELSTFQTESDSRQMSTSPKTTTKERSTSSSSSNERSSVSCEHTFVSPESLPLSEDSKETSASKKKRRKKKKKGKDKDKDESLSPSTDVKEPLQDSEKPHSEQVECNVMADTESDIVIEKSEKESVDEIQEDSNSSTLDSRRMDFSEELQTKDQTVELPMTSLSVSVPDMSQKEITSNLLTSDSSISMAVKEATIEVAAVPPASATMVSLQETQAISSESLSSTSESKSMTLKEAPMEKAVQQAFIPEASATMVSLPETQAISSESSLTLELSESLSSTSESKTMTLKEAPMEKDAVPQAFIPEASATMVSLPETQAISSESSLTLELSESLSSTSESKTMTLKEAPMEKAVPQAFIPEASATMVSLQEAQAISSESSEVSHTLVSSEFIVESEKHYSVAGDIFEVSEPLSSTSESVSTTLKEAPMEETAVSQAHILEASATEPTLQQTPAISSESEEMSSTPVSSEIIVESGKQNTVADEFLEVSSLMMESLESLRILQVQESDSAAAAATSLSSAVSSNQLQASSELITARVTDSEQSVRISENAKDVMSETLIMKAEPVAPHLESEQTPPTVSLPSEQPAPIVPHLESSEEFVSVTSLEQSTRIVPSPSSPKQPTPVTPSSSSSPKQPAPISPSLSPSPNLLSTITPRSLSAPQSPSLLAFNKSPTKIPTSSAVSLESKRDATFKGTGSNSSMTIKSGPEISESYRRKAEFLARLPGGAVEDSFLQRRSSLPVLSELNSGKQAPPLPRSLRDLEPPRPPVRKDNIPSDSLESESADGAPLCPPEDSKMPSPTLERSRNVSSNGLDEPPIFNKSPLTLERKNSPTKRFRDLKHFSRISNMTYNEVLEMEEEEHRRRYDFGYNRRVREMKYFGRICRIDSDESMVSKKSGSSDSGIGHRDLKHTRMMTTSSTSLQVPGASAAGGRRPKGLSDSVVSIANPREFEPIMSYVAYNQSEEATAADMQRHSSSVHRQATVVPPTDRHHQDVSGYGRIQRTHDVTHSTHSLDYHSGHSKFRHPGVGMKEQEVTGQNFQESASNFSAGGQESDDNRSMVSSVSFMSPVDSVTDDDCESIYEDVAMFPNAETMSMRSDAGSVKSMSKLKKFGSKLKKFSKIKFKKFWK